MSGAPRIAPLALALLVLALPALAPALEAGGLFSQGGSSGHAGDSRPELRFSDPTGDVAIRPGLPGLPAHTEGVDVVEVRAYGETGDFIRLAVKVKKLETDRTYDNVYANGVELFACFQLNGHQFAALLSLHFTGGFGVNAKWIGTLKDPCKLEGVTFQKKTANLGYSFDAASNEIRLRLPRRTLISETPGALVRAEAPGPGDALSDLWVMLRDTRKESLRYDAAPDSAPSSDKLTLVHETANLDLVARPAINSPAFFRCGEYQDTYAYAVDVGGKRGVPVTISNKLPRGRAAQLFVETEAGEDWRPLIMPSIQVPAAPDERGWGNVTVNVIVTTPASADHKQCSTIRVRAVDAASPERVGETTFNVVSVLPPSPTRNTFYVHADRFGGNACAAPAGHIWLNLDADDALDVGRDIALLGCSKYREDQEDKDVQGQVEDVVKDFSPAALFPALLAVHMDLNPSHDVVVNTTATGKDAEAVLLLRSDYLDTRARISVFLFAGHPTVQLGAATRDLSLTSSLNHVTFRIPIAFTRDVVPDGDPSRTVDASQPIGLGIRYEPLTSNDNVPQPTAGRVVLASKGTQVTVPIWTTIKRNAIDAGEAGGLISLQASTNRSAFANPEATRVFNLTLLNEAVASDGAKVETALSGDSTPGWRVQLAPRDEFELTPGVPQPLAVGVTPPFDAKESETIRVDVLATSTSDPTARASVSFHVTATRGQELPSESLDLPALPGGKGKRTDAVAFVPVLLILAGSGVWFSRRRD